MSFDAFDRRTRYAAVLVDIIVLTAGASWYVMNTPLDARLLFAIPSVALVLAGIEWDRVMRHHETL